MTIEVSSLRISVDSTSTTPAYEQLDLLADAAGRAETATDKLAKASRAGQAALAKQAAVTRQAANDSQLLANARSAEEERLRAIIRRESEAMRARRSAAAEQKEQVKSATEDFRALQERLNKGITIPQIDLSSFIAQRQQLEASLARESSSLGDVAAKRERLRAALQAGLIDNREYAEGLKAVAKDEQRVTIAMERRGTQLERLLAKYDPTAAAVKRLTADERLLDEALKRGAISAERHANAIARIRVDRTRLQLEQRAINETASAVERLGLNSAATTRDLLTMVTALGRGDLGLASNQILQIGARTGALTSLLTPATLGVAGLVATVGALGIAMLQGSREMASFNLAIATTGNAAGVTIDALEGMVAQVSAVERLAKAEAREVITALVQSGRVGQEVIAGLASGIRTYAKITGQSSKDAAVSLAKLLQDPVKAAEQLAQQFDVLTYEQYRYIRALVEAGREEEARTFVAERFAETLGGQYADNLGYVDQLFQNVGRAARDAWDAIRQFGRDKSIEEQIQQLEALKRELDAAALPLAAIVTSGSRDNRRQELEEQIAALRRQQQEEANKADQQQFQRQRERDLIEAQKTFDRFTESVGGSRAKLEKEIEKIRGAGVLLGTASAEVTQEVVDQLVADFREQNDPLHQRIAALRQDLEGLARETRAFDENLAEADTRRTAALETWLKYTREGRSLLPAEIEQLRALATAADAADRSLRGAQVFRERQQAVQAALTDTDERTVLAHRGLAQATDANVRAFERWLAVAQEAKLLLPEQVNELRESLERLDFAEAGARAQEGLRLIAQQTLEITGRTAEAQAIEIERRYAQLRADLQTTGNTAGVAQLDVFLNAQQAKQELAQLEAEVDRIFGKQGRREQTIDLNIQAGLQSEATSRKQILALHAATADEVEALIPRMRELAAVTGDPAAQARLEELMLKVRELREHVHEVALAFGNAFEDSLGNAIAGLATNVTSLGDAVRGFLLDITESMARFAAENIANEARTKVLSLFTKAPTEVPAGETGAAAGATATQAAAVQLQSAGATVQAGGTTVQTAATQLQTAASTAASAGTSLQTGASTLATAGSALPATVSGLTTAAGTLNAGATTLATTVPGLQTAASTLLTAAQVLASAIPGLTGLGPALTASTGALTSAVPALTTAGSTLAAGVAGLSTAAPILSSVAPVLGAAGSSLVTGATTLSTVVPGLTAAGTTLASGATALTSAAPLLSSSAAALTPAATAIATAAPALGTAAAAITGGAGTLAAAAPILAGAGPTLSAAGGVLSGAAGGLTAAAFQLQTAALALQSANLAGSASGFGFASGGFTGEGGKFEPAGVVHRGEWVTRSEVVRQPGAKPFLAEFNRIGMRALDDLPGFAGGGLVGAAPLPSSSENKRGANSLLVGLSDGLVLQQLDSHEGTELLVKKIARNPAKFRGALGLA